MQNFRNIYQLNFIIY